MRVPVGFGIDQPLGVRRPDRSVSMNDAYDDAVNTLLAWMTPLPDGRAGGGIPEPSPDWMSDIVNSPLGGILGQGSLPETQRAASEWAAQQLSLPTPGGAMRQERIADVINTALEWIRPLALADVGVEGSPGSMMFPFPAHAPGAAGAARKARGAAGGWLRRALARLAGGGDEAVSAVAPVVRETAEAAGRTSRPYYRSVDELEAAALPAWEGGPTLYTGGSADFGSFTARSPMSAQSTNARPAMGQATYTNPDPQFAATYAQKGVDEAAEHAATFGTPRTGSPLDYGGTVQNVRFTGEGAPSLLDYGGTEIADNVKQAVLETVKDMNDLLVVHRGTRVWTDAEIAPLLSKVLDNPRATYADIHGFSEAAHTGVAESSLRGFVHMVAARNTGPGMPFHPNQVNEMVSLVMDRLRVHLSNAGYHGYRVPVGGGYHAAQIIRFGGARGRPFGGTIAWFNPDRDLEIVGTAYHGVYRADNFLGSPTELRQRPIFG